MNSSGALPDMKKVGEDKCLFGVESAGNNVLCVLPREPDAILQLKVGLEQKLFVIYARYNVPPEHIRECRELLQGLSKKHSPLSHIGSRMAWASSTSPECSIDSSPWQGAYQSAG